MVDIGATDTFTTYLTSNNTGNVAHNLAVTFLSLSRVQADSLQLLKSEIEVLTNQLEQLNEMTALVRKWRPATTTDSTKAASEGTKGPLGDTEAESKEILNKLKYWGVEIKDSDYVKQDSGKPYQVFQGTFDQWLTTLSTTGDTISAGIRQLETMTQSRLDQWSKNMDWVSEFLKKLADISQTIVKNVSN